MLSELTAPPKCGTTSMRADYSLIGTARRRSGLRLDRLSDLIPYALETDWPLGAAGFETLHLHYANSQGSQARAGGFEPLHFRIGTRAEVRILPPEPVVPENSIRADSRDHGESLHHPA
jgi:hypothetical protein